MLLDIIGVGTIALPLGAVSGLTSTSKSSVVWLIVGGEIVPSSLKLMPFLTLTIDGQGNWTMSVLRSSNLPSGLRASKTSNGPAAVLGDMFRR